MAISVGREHSEVASWARAIGKFERKYGDELTKNKLIKTPKFTLTDANFIFIRNLPDNILGFSK
jgi:hypothetical protein